MTRRLGGNGRSGLAIIATLSLAVALAGGSTMVGCGSSSSSGPPSGVDGGDGAVGHPDGSTFDGGDVRMQDTEVRVGHRPPGTGPETGVPEAGVQAAEPTFAPVPGTFTAAQSVAIASTTPNATIFFTVDMTQPSSTSASSPVFNSPRAIAQTTTIFVRWRCTAPGFTNVRRSPWGRSPSPSRRERHSRPWRAPSPQRCSTTTS